MVLFDLFRKKPNLGLFQILKSTNQCAIIHDPQIGDKTWDFMVDVLDDGMNTSTEDQGASWIALLWADGAL